MTYITFRFGILTSITPIDMIFRDLVLAHEVSFVLQTHTHIFFKIKITFSIPRNDVLVAEEEEAAG